MKKSLGQVLYDIQFEEESRVASASWHSSWEEAHPRLREVYDRVAERFADAAAERDGEERRAQMVAGNGGAGGSDTSMFYYLTCKQHHRFVKDIGLAVCPTCPKSMSFEWKLTMSGTDYANLQVQAPVRDATGALIGTYTTDIGGYTEDAKSLAKAKRDADERHDRVLVGVDYAADHADACAYAYAMLAFDRDGTKTLRMLGTEVWDRGADAPRAAVDPPHVVASKQWNHAACSNCGMHLYTPTTSKHCPLCRTPMTVANAQQPVAPTSTSGYGNAQNTMPSTTNNTGVQCCMCGHFTTAPTYINGTQALCVTCNGKRRECPKCLHHRLAFIGDVCAYCHIGGPKAEDDALVAGTPPTQPSPAPAEASSKSSYCGSCNGYTTHGPVHECGKCNACCEAGK